MTDDGDDERWRPTRRQAVAVLVAVLVVGVGVGYAAFSGFTATQDARLVADSGATVVFGTQTKVADQHPFVDSETIKLNSTRFRSAGSSSVRVDTLNDGTWTNVSAASVSGTRMYINRSDTRPVAISGTVDALSVRSLNLSKSNATTDLVATSGGSWELVVNDTGYAQGQGLVVVDQSTGEPLDSAAVNANGNAVFDDLPSVTGTQLNVKEGPSELRVFEESNPDKLVDGLTLRVRVFGTESGDVVEREVTNGKMDLTGLPSDEPIVITVSEDASDDYAYRRIIVDSLEQQQEIYLLNTTANPDDVEVIFELQDRTGDFQSGETRLYIEKVFTKDFDGDGSNETQYQVISGDLFGGTSEFTTVLESEERYRLRLENGQGKQRMLGSYTAKLDDRVTLDVGRVSIQASGNQSYAADLRTLTNDTDGDGYEEQFVKVVYVDAERATDQLDYTIRNRTAGTVVTTQTLQGPFGEHVATYKVADNATAASYRLTWNATREQPDGTTVIQSGTQYAGDVPGFFGQIPLDQRWASLIGYVSIVAVAGLVVIGEPALGGLAATGWAAALTLFGVVTIPAPALGLGGALSVVALLGRVQR